MPVRWWIPRISAVGSCTCCAECDERWDRNGATLIAWEPGKPRWALGYRISVRRRIVYFCGTPRLAGAVSGRTGTNSLAISLATTAISRVQAMSRHELMDSRNPVPQGTGCVPPAATAEGSMSDLINRLDALVQSYGGAEAAAAPPPAQTPIDRGGPVAASPPAASQMASAKRAEAAVPRAGSCPSNAMVTHRELPPELKAAKIMVVDDEEATILTVQHYLRKEGYERFIATTKPREAFELMRRQEPDIVLIDIRMPEVSGLDILRVKGLDSTLDHIPVIVLTATTDPGTKRLALNLGATDFLTKPVDPNDLTPRVRNALAVKKNYDQKADEAARLEEIVRQRTVEVLQSREQLIVSLARAAEHRDNETGNHVLRVGRFAGLIARELGWSESQAEMLEHAAPLHDVGKIGVPDSILFKPGKLDPQEFDVIKNHCAWGKQIIEPFSGHELTCVQSHARRGENILHVRSSAMLMLASRIAQTHHENWDGTGYPLGLAGDDIPIEGRITAVADVFDALATKRPYKDPFSFSKCLEILEEQRGKKFDPRVLDAFLARKSDVVAIQMELMDPCPPGRSAAGTVPGSQS
ncbi:MAG: response regulator [Planctomycetes bacterium]|nr:response regulator [Planctomycetota bacterium]